MNILIRRGDIISGGKVLKDTAMSIEGSKIAATGKSLAGQRDVRVIDAKGCFVTPGFIDSHIHGNPCEIISNETRHGTTAFVVAVSCGRPVPEVSGYSGAIGVRLEGPYINPSMAGAQDRKFIRKSFHSGIGITEIRSDPGMLMMTLAPELPGAKRLIRLCKKHNILPSIGHSDASYEEAKNSFGLGIRHATHLFNAMSGPRHGTAGAGLAALFDKRVNVEVIADLKHVRPELLRLVFAVKNPDKIILITDSVRAEKTVFPTPGVGMVGGMGHMIDCVRNVVRHCGVSLPDAVKMASLNPAKLFGVEKRKGSITPGKDADLALFDKNFNVKFTIIGGKIVYQKKGLR